MADPLLDRRIESVEQWLTAFTEYPTLDVSTTTTTTANSSFWKSTPDAPPSLTAIAERYCPPVHLRTQFRDLYRALRRSLYTDKCNAAAFLLGMRGTGKSMLLSNVLTAITHEIQSRATTTSAAAAAAANSSDKDNYRTTTPFRLVYVNGIRIPGHSVQAVVRDIVRQLSEIAYAESRTKKKTKQNSATTTTTLKQRKTKTPDGDDDENCHEEEEEEDRMEQILRLKQTSFTNQLQMLTEILQLACIDGVPIVLILDEMDTFLYTTKTTGATTSTASDTNNRQLLLYHLLERVATEGSLCSLVGISSDAAIMTKLEKRIKSRAEGTAIFLLTGPCTTYEQLAQVMCNHHHNTDDKKSEENNDDDDNNNENGEAKKLRNEVFSVWNTDNSTNEQQQRVHDSLLRCYQMGKDLRWFSRVMYAALTSYRYDLIQISQRINAFTTTKQNSASVSHPHDKTMFPLFTAKYLEEALVDMGGSLLFKKQNSDNGGMTTGTIAKTSLTISEPDLRMQALRDLSGPQVAIVLAAKRILVRDSTVSSGGSGAVQEHMRVAPLTFRRILHEYQSSYKGQSSRYTERILRIAFTDLMQIRLLRPAADHSGLGPFRYLHRDVIPSNGNQSDLMDRTPLHLVIDIHHELKQALENNNMLHCSTALREWGRKTN
jgi:hypothetical protein